jgi:uncharacterized membrane protein
MKKSFETKFQRLKSIDIFRGLCMAWMISSHLINWWLKSEFSWLHGAAVKILDPIGASGFLFISGVSIALSYRKGIAKSKNSEEYSPKILRNSYLFRTFFIFIFALVYNFTIALTLKDIIWIWTWFVLLTTAVSMILAWPLLKISKLLRVTLGILIIIANQFIIGILLPHEGEKNIYGILYYILYHRIYQDPILSFFPFFLLGTVVGDILFDSIQINNHIDRNTTLKNNLIIPLIISGSILIILGLIFKFPGFLNRGSFSWIVYSVGVDLILFSIFLIIENFIITDSKKSYKFLFYYSYYSLTVYLSHNLLYFLFLKSLNLYNIWFCVMGTFIFLGIFLRAIYKTLGAKASLKVTI